MTPANTSFNPSFKNDRLLTQCDQLSTFNRENKSSQFWRNRQKNICFLLLDIVKQYTAHANKKIHTASKNKIIAEGYSFKIMVHSLRHANLNIK